MYLCVCLNEGICTYICNIFTYKLVCRYMQIDVDTLFMLHIWEIV